MNKYQASSPNLFDGTPAGPDTRAVKKWMVSTPVNPVQGRPGDEPVVCQSYLGPGRVSGRSLVRAGGAGHGGRGRDGAGAPAPPTRRRWSAPATARRTS